MSHVRLAAPAGVRAEWLSPGPAPRSTWVESALIVVLGVVIAFPRAGSEVFRGVVWAEDGSRFLQDAYDHHGGWTILFRPYAGYGHLVPRLTVALVNLFPIAWHGLLLCLAATLVQALIALFAFHVVRAHCRGRVAGLLAALAVVAVPVGPEVSANVANLQWFLLFAGCIAALWQPRTALGRTASIVVLAGCALSCPFGGLAVAIAAFVWYLTRRRDLLVLATVGVICELGQLLVITTSPARETPGHAWWNPLNLLAAYLRRVLGDGVFGAGRHPWDDPAHSLVPGLVVVGALGALAYVAWRLGGPRATTAAAFLLAVSLVAFVIPVGLTGIDPRAPMAYAGSGRYYVAPALLVLVVVGVLSERIVVPGDREVPAADSAVWKRSPIWSRVLAWSLLASVGFGLVTSYHAPAHYRNAGTPSWSSQISNGREACRSDPERRQAGIAIAPEGWFTVVPCSRLVNR